MKNKEIEEILNKMKNCNGVFDYYLEYGEVDLLLSYIEQLQSNWNSLREFFENEKKAIEEDELFCYLSNKDYIEFILDKMNELEKSDIIE